jgi:hypothetical protein
MASKPRWGLIILGVVLFVVVVGMAVIGTLAYIGYKQFSYQAVTTGNPEAEFAKVQARFDGQQPLVEMRPAGDGGPLVHRETLTGSKGELSSLHFLAWDPRQKKLVTFTMPFWLVRLGGKRPFHFRTEDDIFSSDDLNVTADDIERHGPGLILDYQKNQVRVLVWTD